MSTRVALRRWTAVAAFALIALVAAADIAAGPMVVLIGGLSMGPLVASLQATRRQTLAAALVAIATGVVLGWPDGIAGEIDHFVRMGVVTLAGAISMQATIQRERREVATLQLARVAEVAQEVMLRPPPERLAHVGLAAHYVSASDVAHVGGDLYETAYTPRGVRLIIGDVRGKGLDAIRLAATVLAAFRESAWEADLLTVARNLDARVTAAAGDEEFVTALLAEIPADGGLTLINLGHHAPLRIGTDRVTELQPVTPTLPLGLGPQPVEHTYDFAPGDRLLLFTDGLVEARDERGEFFPLADHVDTLRGGSLQESVDALVARLLAHVPGRLIDDMAVLLAERLPDAGSPDDEQQAGGTLTLEPSPASAGRARTFVAEALGDLQLDMLIERAQLAVSELVTNAILHADTPIEVAVTAVEPGVRIEVCDDHPGMPAIRAYGGYATTGRGLSLVSALAADLGVERKSPVGKRVWFTLDKDQPDADVENTWSAWDLDGLLDDDPDIAGADTPTVVFKDLPVLLWLAAQQHHDAVLRELTYYRAEHGHDRGRADVAAAQQAEALLASAVDLALNRADAHHHSPRLPAGHPSPLPSTPETLDVTMAPSDRMQERFAALQDVLDEAERLAAAGRLLIRPALPEVIAVRDWCCEQVIAQGQAVPAAAWTGSDREVFTRDDSNRFQTDAPRFDTSPVRDADRAAVAADDNNRIIAVSRPAAELLGWEVDDLVGRRVVTLVPPRFREAHVAGFTRHLTTGEAHVLGVELDLPVLHADGHEIVCTFLIEMARAAPGRTVYIAWLTPTGD